MSTTDINCLKKLDGDAQEEQEAPDADAAVEFWRNISDQTTKHKQETGWLDDVGEGLQDVPRQSNIGINVEELALIEYRVLP